ncbi:MAG: Ig-like domain-containing protein [Bacilli bacterium]|nr:Ig-like domain-containing protein [Bacilli bacterium]
MNSLKQSLNAIREISSTIYHEYVPVIDDSTDISAFAQPLFDYPVVYNEFCDALVNKLVYSQFETMTFNNPLRVLEGDRIPLGYAGEHVYTNPAQARGFNVNDFAGLLVKYEADVKVEYHTVNSDIQYCVTIARQQLKKAMTSWDNLANFITQLSNSLYNGAYIDMFRYTKNIISGAYKENRGVIQTITAVSNEATAKAFVEKARELFLNFQLPSDSYNAWAKNGGAGRPIITWTRPEDIVMIVRNDIRAKLDVEVLASAFNIDRATLLGNIITVDNFDAYDDDGTKVFDGSAIVGMLADKAWFKIKTQDFWMDNFYNPNNRTMQYYLNVQRMYNMSLFANGVIFATSAPTVNSTAVEFIEGATASVKAGEKITLHVKTTPFTANNNLSYTSSDTDAATVGAQTGKYIEVTGVAAGSATITVSDGTHSDTLTLTVTSA